MHFAQAGSEISFFIKVQQMPSQVLVKMLPCIALWETDWPDAYWGFHLNQSTSGYFWHTEDFACLHKAY